MIPVWQTSLLCTSFVEEFSFSYLGTVKVFMDGKRSKGEWLLTIRVDSLPYFAWGCKHHHTKLKGESEEVIRYYMAVVLNQMGEYGVPHREDILDLLKGDLQKS